ncbi:MAG: glycosyl hydrolase [Acidobacteria bacterium]|nr:glycosyl hydrolase [Acidobacteriota bacterium]
MQRALAVLFAATLLATPAGAQEASTFDGLQFRGIGPSLVTGRVADLEIDPNDASTWYLAVGSGGLWKTTNRGNTWTPIFDDYPSYSMGSVVVDPNDSNVVWLGTGENTSNRSTGYGHGVYKSVDAGATWQHIGLADSQHIQKVMLDPRDSDTAYVAAQGPLWNGGGDRGLYKTTDGGASWERVLHVSDDTGITDVVFAPRNPEVLYAAAYQRRRHVGQTIAGGPEAGIFKSTDAGATWERLTEGLPTVDMGRIALATDPRHDGRVYALVVAQDDHGGFFRSEDAGATWTRTSEYSGGDPQYYGEMWVDPHVADTIWVVAVRVMRSTDGGATFEPMNFPIHVDHHEIVFDPDDPRHMWIGNDGGLYETFDSGATWRHFTNLPLSQFYRVSADDSRPFYTVCGGTQDNGTHCGPSRSLHAFGVRTSDWYSVGGGDGFQSYFDPEYPELVYRQSQNGVLGKHDLSTGEVTGIRPLRETSEAGDDDGEDGIDRGRWHWDSPLVVSEHASGRLYYAGNRLYRSDDRGETWEAVSDDLTRQLDPDASPVMGQLWPENAVGRHLYTTALSVISTLDESPLLAGLLYVGTDDGLLHVSENGGESWDTLDNVIPGLPDNTYVTDVYASRRNSDVVFATFNNFQRGDFRPFVYRSDDRGQTWQNITANLPERSGAWSIVQDHVNPDLLFVGLEFGLYFSVDGGGHWTQLRGGIPTAMARDLHIQPRWNDLIVGTFGRGAYVLDDYSALREVSAEILERDAWLFDSRPALLYEELRHEQAVWGNDTHPNPPYGAQLTYYLRDVPAEGEQLFLVIDNEAGERIRSLELPAASGLQRVAWDLRHEPIEPEEGSQRRRPRPGPRAEAGRFRARLESVIEGERAALAEPQVVLVVPLER